MRGREHGFTLVEALMALALIGIALAGIVPSFVGYLGTNSAADVRAGAVAAARQTLEGLRAGPLSGLPAASTREVTVGDRTYGVQVRSCVRAALCTPNTRQLEVEVSFRGVSRYRVETVFTELR